MVEDFLVTGGTGSGKTLYVLSKVPKYVEDVNVFVYASPSVALAVNVYRYVTERYGSRFKVTRDPKADAHIYVLTWHTALQYVAYRRYQKRPLYSTVLVVDEFHMGVYDLFRPVFYALVKGTQDVYRRYFVSATPVEVPFVEFKERIDMGEGKVPDVYLYGPDAFEELVKSLCGTGLGLIYTGRVSLTESVAVRVAELCGFPEDEDVDVSGFDDKVLATLVRKGVAYYNSSLTYGDRRVIDQLLAEEKLKVLVATTAVSVGVNYNFSWAVFRDVLSLDKVMFRQVVGRVGRFGKGEVYVPQGVKLPDPPPLKVTEEDEEFARYYLPESYEGADAQTNFLIAFHLVKPSVYRKIVDMPVERVEDYDYMLCRLFSVDVKGAVDLECAKYGINASAKVAPVRDFINGVPVDEILEKYGMKYGEFRKLIEEYSYLAHVLGVFKDERYERLAVSIREGVNAVEFEGIEELVELPFIGRARAVKLWEAGIRKRGDLCEKADTAREVLGEKLATRLLSLVCRS